MPIETLMTDESSPRRRRRSRVIPESFIVETGTRLFSELGYPGVSIRDIAAACDANVSSIYHHFRDKDDLYDRCCEHAFRGVAERLRMELADGSTPQQRLLHFTMTLCDVLLNSEQFRRLLQRELLLSRSARFEALTKRHFTEEYRDLVPIVAALSTPTGARARTFLIYSTVFGVIALQPIARIANAGSNFIQSPRTLARFVLQSILPGHNW